MSGTDREIVLTASAFGRVEPLHCLVSAEGTVRVWDGVAGYFTLCHGLPRADEQRARESAAQLAGAFCVLGICRVAEGAGQSGRLQSPPPRGAAGRLGRVIRATDGERG